MGGRLRRAGRAVLAGCALALAVGSPAHADPAGPTDYLSEVTAIDPATTTITVVVIGGDSFVELEAAPGTEVIVIGYRGEEYLWFRADGTVLENQNSPSKYTNEERYGGGEIPASATPDAEPAWDPIGSGGRWAWHDHRAHWMQQIRPVGMAAGDQILEAVIPLRVDGGDVDVTVISTWQPAASRLPIGLGVVAGLATVALGWLLRSGRWFAAVALPPAVLALVAGVWQYVSLPPETGPRTVWWLLPALATVGALVGIVAARRGARFVAWAAVLLTGVELAIWGYIKRDGLS
ncbi:MAG: hypothetical protein ACR2O6_10035, partial [Ilumatobacteraceae bacterium]